VASRGPSTEVTHQIGEGRGVYAYVIDGAASSNHENVSPGDAAKLTDQSPATGVRQSELILVDVPMQFEAVGIWRRLESGPRQAAPGQQGDGMSDSQMALAADTAAPDFVLQRAHQASRRH
jgi:hypothetical protein